MSHILDPVSSPCPVVDPRLKGKIFFCTTGIIPEEINLAMSAVIFALANRLDKEGGSFGNFPLTCVFASTSSFSVEMDDEEQASCFRIAFYPLPRLRPHIGRFSLYTVLAEELCHLIWDISDETEICFKVLEVVREIFPSVELSDLFSPDCVNQCKSFAKIHPQFSALLPSSVGS